MTFSAPDSTYAAIERKVRRLTASSSQAALSSSDIEQAVNTFYNQDFPYAIKLDQMRSVYTFYTSPYIDTYPLDINFNQGVRSPVYFDGIQGYFFKDREQFFNMWPRWPTRFQQSGTTLTGTITGIAQPTNPTQITSPSHNLTTGAVITITGVVGMTQLNGNSYTITVINANTFSLNGINNAAYGAYVSGGTWTATDQTFSFTIPGPFLRNQVTIGGESVSGGAISIRDDGEGNLQYMTVNPVISDPLQTTNPALPGMYNLNTGNPGLINPTNIGTINYISGQIDFTLPIGVSLAADSTLNIYVSQYQTGRPYSLLFWNNEFTIRPIPEHIHRVEIETYMTPVQFLQTNDHPIVNQWWQYIAYGAACEILRERQDMEGLNNLLEGMQRQEGLVLERQGVEEIGQRNTTIFSATIQGNNNWPNQQGWY